MSKLYTAAELLVGTGSFWITHARVEEQAKIENVINLNLSNTLLTDMEELGKGLGTLEPQLLRGEVYTYSANDAFKTYDAPGATPSPYVAGKTVVTTSELFYVIRYTGDTIPLSIRSSEKGLLALNVDYTYSDDHLWFSTPAAELFFDNAFIIATGLRDIPSYYSYTLQTKTPYHNTDLIEYFYRAQRDLRGLELATNAVGRQPIIRKGGKVLHVNELSEGARYFMESGEVVTVPFEHKRFEKGEHLRRNSIPAEGGVHFILPDAQNPFWYRATNWEYGLSLEGLTIYEGLVVPDELRVSYSAGEDAGSVNGNKLHARMNLVGHWDTQEAYWNEVSESETISGYYINDIIGLDSEDPVINYTTEVSKVPGGFIPRIRDFPNSKMVNPLDVYFEAVLKDKAFIVIIDETKVGNKQEIIDFILTNVIDGIYPIIRIKKSDGGYVDHQLEEAYRTYEILVDEQGTALTADRDFIERETDEDNLHTPPGTPNF